jgi:hypothetical protein
VGAAGGRGKVRALNKKKKRANIMHEKKRKKK